MAADHKKSDSGRDSDPGARSRGARAPDTEGASRPHPGDGQPREVAAAGETSAAPETPETVADARSGTPASTAQATAGAAGFAEPPEASEQAEDLPPLDEVDVLRAERDVLRERFLRLAAEYDNFRKRNAREWREHQRRAAAEVLRELLEFADNLERATQVSMDDAEGLLKGVELIHQKLRASLNRFGIEAVDAKGKPFDPTLHEAVMMVDTEEVESQHVVDVVQCGYTLHGEVLRPAKVTVSR
ncbi:MAG: nucleotide exchange factor GrpE [Candidatus Krumholzibacteriia bacterium]